MDNATPGYTGEYTIGVKAPGPVRGDHVHIDFDEFELPRSEMFGDTKNPVFTVNVKSVSANAVCVRLLWYADYVVFGICRKRRLLLLVPCDERVVHGFKWAKEKGGKRYGVTRIGEPFVLSICQMMGWDPNQRHRIPGRLINDRGVEMMSFALAEAKHFDKPNGRKGGGSQIIFTGDWDGHFGPKFSEGYRTLQMYKFDKLTVWSIKDGDTDQTYTLPEAADSTEDGQGSADGDADVEKVVTQKQPTPAQDDAQGVPHGADNVDGAG